jgi:SAM-dependent methyltransferase
VRKTYFSEGKPKTTESSFKHLALKGHAPGTAVNVGSGNNLDMRALTGRGWSVYKQNTAFDLKNSVTGEESVDLINAQHLTLPETELTAMLVECFRILRPGAYFCASFFGRDHSHFNAQNQSCFYRLEELENFFAKAGFEIVEEEQVAGRSGGIANCHEIRIVAQRPACMDPALQLNNVCCVIS